MATSGWGVNSAEAVKLWSRKIMHEAIKKTWLMKFAGKSSDSFIQITDETTKSEGDRIRTILRMQLTGSGVQGDNVGEGNEETLVTHTDDLIIDQLRHFVRSRGRMSEQRVPFSVREEIMYALSDWWATRWDVSGFNQLASNTAQTDTRFTGNNPVTTADAAHSINAQGRSDVTSTASQIFTLSDIDRMVLTARTLKPVIRKGDVGAGQKAYLVFITPEMHFDLRRNTNQNEWMDLQKAAIQGGQVSKNPVWTGALGYYNGAILHESFNLPLVDVNGGTKNGGRALLMGAQAACMAFGRGDGPNRMTWVEEFFDYQNQLGVAAGSVFGLKKSIYNSQDFAVINLKAFHSNEARTVSGR